jgi:hypothetical protein
MANVVSAPSARWRHAHVLIAGFALLGCQRRDPLQSDTSRPVVRVKPTIENVPLGGRSKDIEVIEAVKIMSDCPIRTQLTDVGRQASERQKIIACLGKLARYRTSVLRAAEVEYTKDSTARGAYSQLDDLGVLFLLNRYIFNVPDASPRSEARFFGGWEGVPVTENEVNLLWPWQSASLATWSSVARLAAITVQSSRPLRNSTTLTDRSVGVPANELIPGQQRSASAWAASR